MRKSARILRFYKPLNKTVGNGKFINQIKNPVESIMNILDRVKEISPGSRNYCV
jgi:hypothetical protein